MMAEPATDCPEAYPCYLFHHSVLHTSPVLPCTVHDASRTALLLRSFPYQRLPFLSPQIFSYCRFNLPSASASSTFYPTKPRIGSFRMPSGFKNTKRTMPDHNGQTILVLYNIKFSGRKYPSLLHELFWPTDIFTKLPSA